MGHCLPMPYAGIERWVTPFGGAVASQRREQPLLIKENDDFVAIPDRQHLT